MAAEEKTQTRLVSDYESIRRQEYELITDLLDILPKVDNLGDESVAQVRDALFHADHPYLMVFVGPFSCGKTSIVNALLGEKDLLAVGPTPTTDRITILRWGEEPERMVSGEVHTVFHPSPLLKRVSFVDTPGLESVFQRHEDRTRNFLHRSDVVLLVMMATQAMTASNLEYMKKLQDVGKKVIVVLSQVDLLTEEEKQTVRQYVLDQSQSRLGAKPDVWMVSAMEGMAAWNEDGTRDDLAWHASGMNLIEDYINEQLSDVARLRQKLQTPLQIMQSVGQTALTAVRDNQTALDHYQSIADNIDKQLEAQKRSQEKTVREINSEIGDKFGEAAMRGSEAIRDVFQLSRALGSLLRGLTELVGLAGLVRRVSGKSHIYVAFERRKAFEPVRELPTIAGRLAPRLEGQDIQDIDDLVKYAKREIDALPDNIQQKVIGTIQAPVHYDRAALQEIRADLESVEEEARQLEIEKLEQSVRNTLLTLAAYEILLIVFGVALISAWSTAAGVDPILPVVLLIVMVMLGLVGLLFLPLRGRLLENNYTKRMLTLQARYIEIISKAADKQIEYGVKSRRDVVSPLTRLVEAQTQIQKDQLYRLQNAQQRMGVIEADLASLGKRRLLG